MFYRVGGDTTLNPSLIWRSALVSLAFSFKAKGRATLEVTRPRKEVRLDYKRRPSP
jgi:hypothetical protein